MVTARQLTQRQQQIAYNTVQDQNAINDYVSNLQSQNTPSPTTTGTWNDFVPGTTTDQIAMAGSTTMNSFGVNVKLGGRGTYTSAEMVGNMNLGGNQGTGLPFGNYTIGAAPNKLGAENQTMLYGGNRAMSGSANTQQNREAATDLALVKVGQDLNFYASSAGSPNDNARLAGIQGTSDFYRLTNKYGSEVRVGGAGNPNAGVTFPSRGEFTGGAYPANWNKDDKGNPLPWGTRREPDGKVYTTTGGGDNFAGTTFFSMNVPSNLPPTNGNLDTNINVVLAIPTKNLGNLKMTYSSPVYHSGDTPSLKKTSFYSF